MHIEHQYNTLKETMYVADGGFPRLKGQAAEIRRVVRPLMHVFKLHMDVRRREHRLILLGLQTSLNMEDTLDMHASEYCWPLDTIFLF